MEGYVGQEDGGSRFWALCDPCSYSQHSLVIVSQSASTYLWVPEK